MDNDVGQSSIRRRALTAAIATLISGAILGAAFDAWYGGLLVSRERERIYGAATPYASALESTVGRRVSRLSGLRTFVETRRSREDLYEEFRPFADGLRAGASGIRALELVRDGRVQSVVPLESNEVVLGYDLYGDARPSVPSDVRRALQSGAITVTGPISLLQGGLGLVVRQRITRVDSTFPDLVAMVLDLPPLFAEAQSFSPAAGVRYVLRDRKGAVLAGTDTSIVDPVLVEVRIPDGSWSLAAAPASGWRAAVAEDMWPTRIASLVILSLIVWVSYMFVDRQARLTGKVEERTAALRDANAVLVREVHERETVEQQLREKDERLRLALQAGRMGVWDYDPVADRIAWSGSALEVMGHDGNSALQSGAAFMTSLAPETRDLLRDAVQQVMQGRESRIEYRTIAPDGSERWLYGVGELQRGASGEPVRLVGILADITERRQLEEQLLHSQKMEAVGTLAGGIAHDFNNLLTAILGFTQLAQHSANALLPASTPGALTRGVDELNTDLDEILKAGERAALLTAQLLAFSRRQVVNPTYVDANVVVHDVERMLQRLIGERIQLSTAFATDALPVRADQGQLAQVVVNLVVNARDALPAGGTIRVVTERTSVADVADAPLSGLTAGEWVVLTVSDDGVGMSPEVASRAFEPFFTTKAVGEGTGLGLSTVYGIVTQAGGRIFVESAPGAGTTVRVVLPVWDGPERAPRITPVSAPVVSEGERVLVVEDEGGLRRLVAEILTRRGYAVTVASEGGEALASLADHSVRYELVLTDMVMPGLDGIALAREIRRAGLTMPILFMSGYPSGEPVPKDASHAFIAKPFTPDALAEQVRVMIRRAKSAREVIVDGAQVPTGSSTLP